jgi:putative flavoprotein involved in K+ transport
MPAISTGEEDLPVNEPAHSVGEAEVTLERFSVVVIGGGHAGLAAGYELAQCGIDFVILDRCGRLGENWRPRWDPVRLFTPARFDGLPGFPFDGEEGRYLTRDQISDYLERYAERFGLPVRLGIDVLGLRSNGVGQLLVEWEHGGLAADQVIITTDLDAAQHRTASDRDRRIIHLRAGEHRTLSQLSQAGDVVVLGARSTGIP